MVKIYSETQSRVIYRSYRDMFGERIPIEIDVMWILL